MSLLPGTQLGPYKILAPLGAGEMGEVYLAKDPRLDREVAIKVLPEHLAGNPAALKRFFTTKQNYIPPLSLWMIAQKTGK